MCVAYLPVKRIGPTSAICNYRALDELEEIGTKKDGIRQLLNEKWRKVYWANSPYGLLTKGEMRAA